MLDISPIRQQSLGEQVAHKLRTLIITGGLGPGEHLVEANLSQEFGVSRGPIRDALRVLEAEGLLESRRRGVFVVGLHDDDIGELYSLRESMESMALRLSAQQIGGEQRSAFEAALASMREAADRGDARDFAVADLEFHSQFYLLAGHRRLLSVWQHYQPTFTVLLQVTTAQDPDLHPSAESHVELLRLIQAGQIDAALAELSGHLLGASNRLRRAHQQLRDRQSS
jgi:GntR family transcriptional regulator of gluconate operon